MAPDTIVNSVWRIGDAEFNAATGMLTSDTGSVTLDRSCRAILLALMQAHGEPISKDELLALGWPGRIVHENSLAKAVSRLRQALGHQGEALEALYGQGYCLRLPVEAFNNPRAGRAAPVSRRDLAHGYVAISVSLLVVLAAAFFGWRAHVGQMRYQQQTDALFAFLSEELLAPADPYTTAQMQEPSLRTIVEQTAASLESRFGDHPPALMALHRVVANAFSGWGQYEKAVTHFDKAHSLAVELFGVGAAESVPIDIELCQNMRLSGATRRAEPVCSRAEHLAKTRAPNLLPAARIARAKLLFETGDYTQAVERLTALRQSAQHMDDNQKADAAWFLGLSLRKLARYDQADAAFVELVELRERTLGGDHPLSAWAYADYGDFLIAAGRFTEAEPMLQKAQRVFDATLGPEHLESQTPAYSLAEMRQWQGRHEEARQLLRPILVRYREALGSDHYWTLYTMTELAFSEAERGDRSVAQALLYEARKTGERILYGRPGKAAYFHMSWSRTLIELGDLDQAVEELQRARDAFAHDIQGAGTWLAYTDCVEARLALSQHQPEQAVDHALACREGLQQAPGLPLSYPGFQEVADILRLAGSVDGAQYTEK